MTGFELASRFVAEIAERPGEAQHPLIQWWLSTCRYGFDAADEVPWCSAVVNGICWELRAPRSKSATARSWLGIGAEVALRDARPGWDVVILTRPPIPLAGTSGGSPGPMGCRSVSWAATRAMGCRSPPSQRRACLVCGA